LTVTVVIASNGYPEHPVTGNLIEGLDEAGEVEGVTVLHAGTRATANGIVTAGGRVLSITAQGESLTQARKRAYEAIDRIGIEGAHHRSDIARAAAPDA
jgi:phosphoribosylamine--glycine ligase